MVCVCTPFVSMSRSIFLQHRTPIRSLAFRFFTTKTFTVFLGISPALSLFLFLFSPRFFLQVLLVLLDLGPSASDLTWNLTLFGARTLDLNRTLILEFGVRLCICLLIFLLETYTSAAVVTPCSQSRRYAGGSRALFACCCTIVYVHHYAGGSRILFFWQLLYHPVHIQEATPEALAQFLTDVVPPCTFTITPEALTFFFG